jgi:hypothetical protein
MNDEEMETRQQRRDKRRQNKKERIAKHGKGLARQYINAILKRLRGKKENG